MPSQTIRQPYMISDDKALLDLDTIHGFLNRSYWAEGIQKPRVKRVLENSYCFGLYELEPDTTTVKRQVGFARVLSDLSAIAYLMDVFIDEEYRGKGLGKWIVEEVLAYPTFEPVRRWILATDDAHSLYARHGFTPLDHPEHYMHRYDPDKYRNDPPA
ncbi:GNAT family N-acetyltransferase [bacterium]|nr:GNAT family N-acetyltransferase [bacterium]